MPDTPGGHHSAGGNTEALRSTMHTAHESQTGSIHDFTAQRGDEESQNDL